MLRHSNADPADEPASAAEASVVLLVIILATMLLAVAVGAYLANQDTEIARRATLGFSVATGLGIVTWLFCWGMFGIWVATQKGRSAFEGMALAILLGLIGIFLEALLPEFPHERYPRR